MTSRSPYRKKLIALDLSGSFAFTKSELPSPAQSSLKAINDIIDFAPREMDINVISWGDQHSIGVYNYSNKATRTIREQVCAAMAAGINSGTNMAPLIDHYREMMKQSDNTDLIIISDGDITDMEEAAESLKKLHAEFPKVRIGLINIQEQSAPSYRNQCIKKLMDIAPRIIALRESAPDDIAKHLQEAVFCAYTKHQLQREFDAASRRAGELGEKLQRLGHNPRPHHGHLAYKIK